MLCKESDEVFHIDHYDLKIMEKVDGVEGMTIFGEFIKGNIITQNNNGDMFALCYFDNGRFHIRVFDQRKMLYDLNINQRFDIANDTVSIPGFFQPFVCCCFVDTQEIFCNFFS